jgi:hypothetical protein
MARRAHTACRYSLEPLNDNGVPSCRYGIEPARQADNIKMNTPQQAFAGSLEPEDNLECAHQDTSTDTDRWSASGLCQPTPLAAAISR